MGLVGCSAMLATDSRCPLNVFCSAMALGLAGANSMSVYGWRGCGAVMVAHPLLPLVGPLEPVVPTVPVVIPGPPLPVQVPPVPSARPLAVLLVLGEPPALPPMLPRSPMPGCVVPCSVEPSVVPRLEGPVAAMGPSMLLRACMHACVCEHVCVCASNCNTNSVAVSFLKLSHALGRG
eukprot:1158146-Pelagomonas_calceolata.AAC.4